MLRNGANLGFGAACNRATAMGDGDYLLLLNPDTRLEPETLARSVAHMAVHPEIGILGVRLVDADGATHRSCARFPRCGTSSTRSRASTVCCRSCATAT